METSHIGADTERSHMLIIQPNNNVIEKFLLFLTIYGLLSSATRKSLDKLEWLVLRTSDFKP